MSVITKPKQNPWTMMFAGALEREFKAYYQTRSKQFLAVGVVIALLALILCFLLPQFDLWDDAAVNASIRDVATKMRVQGAILALISAFGILISRSPRFWRYREYIFAAGSLASNVVLSTIAYEVPTPYVSACFTAAVMFVFANYISIVTRFPFAIFVGITASATWIHTFGKLGTYPSFHGQANLMYGYFVFANLTGASVSRLLEGFARRQFLLDRMLEAEQQTVERLLLNVMPEKIATRLKAGEERIAELHGEVSVLFADLVGFTTMSAKLPAREVVAMLNELFKAYDDLAKLHGVEKIKTIGDSYLCVAGVPEFAEDHAERALRMGLALLDATEKFNHEYRTQLSVRIGVASGPVVAGIIGKSKFSYDIWGDTVNTAARMESTGKAGTLQVSEATYLLTKDRFSFLAAEKKDIKGKGEMVTYTVKRIDAVLQPKSGKLAA